MTRKYISHFATSMDDAHEVGSWKNIEDAKALCVRQAHLDIFGSPRVYVEELTEYPEEGVVSSAFDTLLEAIEREVEGIEEAIDLQVEMDAERE